MKQLLTIMLSLSLSSVHVNAQENGVSLNPNRFKFNEAKYDKTNYKLISLLYGASEIGAKSCKPAGRAIPVSLENWFSEIKTYSAGEITRDLILNNRIEILKARMNEIANSKSKELQIEAIQIQIDLVNVSIDSIAGSNYFNDGSSEQVAKTGRMPLRENLILAALKSIEKNEEENLKNFTTYQEKLIQKGFVNSIKVAQEACDRKKLVKRCVVTESPEGSSEVCTETEEKDPVKGCDVALAKIPPIQNVLARIYAELYLLPRISSKELNLKMGELEVAMDAAANAIPKSDDAKYDWSTGMIAGIKDMKEARKEAGVLCPGNSKDNFAKAVVAGALESVGSKSDILPDDFGQQVAASAQEKKQINDSAVKFLGTMGIASEERANEAINPKPLKEGEKAKEKDSVQLAAEGFMESWFVSDQVIGQAGQRGKYFSEISLTVDELLTMDYLKLTELTIQKAKLEKYLNDIKTQLNTIKPSAPSSTSTTGLANSKSKANKINMASSLSVSNETNKPKDNSLKLEGASAIKIGTSPGTPLSSIANSKNDKIVANYINGGAAINVSGLGLRGLSSQAISSASKTTNAIARLDTKVSGITSQLKINTPKSSSNTDFKKALNTSFEKVNGSLGVAKTDLTASLSNNAIAPKDFSNDSGSSSSGSGSGSSNSLGSSLTRSYEVDLGNNSNRPAVSAAKAGSESRFPTFPTGKKALAGKKSKSGTGGDFAGDDDSDSMNESQLISSVIDARNLKNKDTFLPTEEDSLFERVTKAYIRNYEKVDDVPPAE